MPVEQTSTIKRILGDLTGVDDNVMRARIQLAEDYVTGIEKNARGDLPLAARASWVSAEAMAQVFKAAGNEPTARSDGSYESGHEPEHSSKSGTCVTIKTDGSWYCSHCKKGGDIVQAYMGLHGIDFKAARELVVAQHGERPRARPDIKAADELLARVFREPRFAVKGLFQEGVTLLAGKPKLGKSYLMLGIAVAVATGGKALGEIDVEAGDVLYLALEDGDRRLQKRLQELLGDSPIARMHYATKWAAVDDGGVEDIESWLKEYPAARLIVVDTLKRIRGRAGATGSSTTSTTRLWRHSPTSPTSTESPSSQFTMPGRRRARMRSMRSPAQPG